MQATKKKMEESDICLLRESLIVQLLNTMKAGDTLIIDTVRRIWPKEKSLIPVYSWLLQNGKHLFSVQQPFLDTRLYKPLIASADESAINAYVSGYIPQVYRTMNIAQHVAISSVADDCNSPSSRSFWRIQQLQTNCGNVGSGMRISVNLRTADTPRSGQNY